MKIEKAAETGFCFGVKRAIGILEKVARERGGMETLGAIVHNQQVLERLARIGVKVVKSPDDIHGDTVVTSAHGLPPQLKEELRHRHINIIDTTCPFVHRTQIAARRLARAGFFTVIYGESDHPEVKSVLGWAQNRGMATLDEKSLAYLNLPHRIGILAQTTQIPARFTEFSKKLIDTAFTRDSELRVIDTICHDIRERQAAALKLAKKTDLMLVIGGHNSANTARLAELCSLNTTTYIIETTAEIQPPWFQGKRLVGITSGTSTAEQTIEEVTLKLESISSE
ncbi:4-hydroxy-3-methylbut-2-enyl diphosphate reductase [Chloroflexota bacterium]